jgi:hypothetical protein
VPPHLGADITIVLLPEKFTLLSLL